MNLAQYAVATKTTPAAFREKLRKNHGVTVTHEAVRMWFSGDRQPKPNKMAAIEAATGGRVTRYHQRPDVFGATPKEAKKGRAA